MDSSRRLAWLGDHRRALRASIKLLTSPMPRGDPIDCRRTAEWLQRELNAAVAEGEALRQQQAQARSGAGLR